MERVSFFRNLTDVKTAKKILPGVALAGILVASGCSAKGRMQRFDKTIDLGNIPTDVCKIDGKPQILNMSTESDGGVNFVYINRNGDVVTQHWFQDGLKLGQGYTRGGEYLLHGDKTLCPSSPTSTPKPNQ